VHLVAGLMNRLKRCRAQLELAPGDRGESSIAHRLNSAIVLPPSTTGFQPKRRHLAKGAPIPSGPSSTRAVGTRKRCFVQVPTRHARRLQAPSRYSTLALVVIALWRARGGGHPQRNSREITAARVAGPGAAQSQR